MQSVALGTKATFSYMPTEDDMKKYLATVTKKGLNHFKHIKLSEEEKA